MVLLANLYLKALGGPKDTTRAIQLLKLAVDRWNPRAAHRLAVVYRDGESGIAQNPPVAFHLFMRSAQFRYPPAITAVGVSYAQGFGVPQNYELAALWLRKAAAKDSVAQHWLTVAEQQTAAVR